MKNHRLNILVFAFFPWLVFSACDAGTKNVDSCGDGFLDPGEACDGSEMVATNCQELGYYEQFGALKCGSECQLDVTVCASRCGDGVVHTGFGERCDHENLLDESCETLGLGSGTLQCRNTCRLDPSGCEIPVVCGDGTIMAPLEECEGLELNGNSCESLGFYMGELKCSDDCELDTSNCIGFCGDGVIQSFVEECEGANLGGATCESLGLQTGTLACTSACRLDISGCGHSCGDGIAGGNEECDGDDLDDNTCVLLGYSDGGTLSCNFDCTLDASGCVSGVQCGNGILEDSEECDGNELGGTTCIELGYYGGTLRCNSQCELDMTPCEAVGRCGDGIPQLIEPCDGDDMNGNSCQTQGFYTGTLVCTENCGLDSTNCTGFCGDESIQSGHESCDGDELGAATCEGIGYAIGGMLSCKPDCTLDTSQCISGANCGNNILEIGEQCDQDFLGGETCMSLGFYGGILFCSEQCTYDLFSCEQAGKCGDGIRQALEVCDMDDLNAQTCTYLGYYGGTLACSATCEYDLSDCQAVGICGDGIIQLLETCDSDNLDGEDCISKGYPSGGTLSCNPDCTLNVDECLGSELCGDGVIQAGETCDGGAMGSSLCRDIPMGFGSPACNSSCSLTAGTCTNILTFGSNENDDAEDIVVDADGNTYIVYSSRGTLLGVPSVAFTNDLFVVKVDNTGEIVWVRNVGTSESDWGIGIAINTSGDLYVSGSTYGGVDGVNNGGSDAFLCKFSNDGTLQWCRQWGSSQNEGVSKVALDSYGNIYLTGTTSGTFHGNTSSGSTDAYLIKFNPAGVRQWTQQWGTNTIDYGRAVALDASNNIYVSGQTASANFDGHSSGDGSYDMYVTKFSSTGAFAWSRQWGSPGVDDSFAIHVHGSEFIVVSGYTSDTMPGNTSAGYLDAVVTKIDPAGNVLWARQWGTLESDKANDVKTDSTGTIWTVGTTQGSIDGIKPPEGMDIFLTGFSAEGVRLSTTQWGTYQQDWGNALVVDALDRLFITGSTSAQLGTYPFVRYADVFIIFVP